MALAQRGMRSALGDIAVGSPHATQISQPRPGASSICMIAFGRGALSMHVSSSSQRTKKAVFNKQATLAPAPGRSTRVEHEYFREGAWTYLAAWDVHRAKVFGRCEKKAPLRRSIA